MPHDPISRLHEIVIEAHDIAETTRANYLNDLSQWIAFAGADPAGWTRRRAQAFYTGLLKRMKPQSANRLMASVQYASRWWAHLENDPTLDFARVPNAKAKDKRPQQALTEDQAQRLLGTCDQSMRGLRDFALLVVGFETGMRRMSLEGMRIEDTLYSGGQRWPYPATFVPIKGRDPGWIPLSDTVLLALRPWISAIDRSEGPVFCALRRRGGHLSPTSAALSRSAMVKDLAKRAELAGLQGFHIHLLRHTFVTWRVEQKLQPHEIASITHHDVTKALGALGGYMDTREIGGRVRNATPAWLSDLISRRIANGSR